MRIIVPLLCYNSSTITTIAAVLQATTTAGRSPWIIADLNIVSFYGVDDKKTAEGCERASFVCGACVHSS